MDLLKDDYESEEDEEDVEDQLPRGRSGTILVPTVWDASWWDVAGVVSLSRSFGIPALGCVMWASILSVAIVGLLVAWLNPVVVPIRVQWEAGGAQWAHTSVSQSALYLPDPQSTPLAVWINTTGLHCSNFSRMGVEKDSPIADLRGAKVQLSDDYPLYRSRSFPRSDVNAELTPFHADDIESIETEPLREVDNRQMSDEPILLFPMLGQTHINLVCRSNQGDLESPVGSVRLITVPTNGGNYGPNDIAVGYTKEAAHVYQATDLRISGAGMYSATIRPVPSNYINRVAAFSHAEVSLQSIVLCGDEPLSDDLCTSLQNTAIIRLETPKVFDVGAGIASNGAFGPFATFVGLVAGLITGSKATAKPLSRIAWSCRRKISAPGTAVEDKSPRRSIAPPDQIARKPVGLCFGLHAQSARACSAILLAIGLATNIVYGIWFYQRTYLPLWGTYVVAIAIPILFASGALLHLIFSIFRRISIGISAALLSAATVTMGASVSLLPPVWAGLNWGYYAGIIPPVTVTCTAIYILSMLFVAITSVDIDMAAFVTKHDREPLEMMAQNIPDGVDRCGRILGFVTVLFRERFCCLCRSCQVVTIRGETMRRGGDRYRRNAIDMRTTPPFTNTAVYFPKSANERT